MNKDFEREKKALEVCKEMFQIRNYKLIDEGYGEELGWYLIGESETNKIIHCYIMTQPKLNIDLIKYYYSILTQHQVTHAILVYKYNVTSSVNKILESIDVKIELFQLDELQYNLLNHSLVPKHIKIKTLKKNEQKYPILKKTDPVSRFMGFKFGDIIEIHRKNGSIYYRFVK